MPRVNKRHWHSPNDAQAMFRTRLIFEDERGKVVSKKSLVMNELRQKWSVDCMNTPTRYTIAKRFGKTALNFLYQSRYSFISANLKLYTRCTNASLIFFCSVCILRSASTSIVKSCDTSPRSSDSAPVSSLPCWDVNSLHVQNLAHFQPWVQMLDICTNQRAHWQATYCRSGDIRFGASEQAALIVSLSTFMMAQMMITDGINDGKRETKDGSKHNFISCPFPHALGPETATRKQEKKAPPPPTMRDQHFDLFWATAGEGQWKKWLVTFGRDSMAKERPIW